MMMIMILNDIFLSKVGHCIKDSVKSQWFIRNYRAFSKVELLFYHPIYSSFIDQKQSSELYVVPYFFFFVDMGSSPNKVSHHYYTDLRWCQQVQISRLCLEKLLFLALCSMCLSFQSLSLLFLSHLSLFLNGYFLYVLHRAIFSKSYWCYESRILFPSDCHFFPEFWFSFINARHYLLNVL